METYLIKTNILLAVFYGFYYLLLRKETFFSLNRLFLVGTLLLSCLLPLLPQIHYQEAPAMLGKVLEGIQVTDYTRANNHTKALDLINPLMIIYLTGVTWFSLRFLSNLGRIVFLYQRFPKTNVRGLRTVVLKGDQPPFTFFNVLFISEADLENSQSASIIEHESVHVSQWHSLDVLLAEIIAVLFWFNPFVWLLKSALRIGHEYAADEKVLKKGYNQASYQCILLRRTMGDVMIGLANNFNYSLLKNRMYMMTKNKSGIRAYLKYLLAFPLLVLLFAFTLTNAREVVIQDEKVYDSVEVMPEFPGGMMAVRQHLAQNLRYPEIAAKQGVTGRIFVQFVVAEDGSVQNPAVLRTDINEKLDNEVVVVGYSRKDIDTSSKKEGILAIEKEAVRVIGTLPDFKPGLNKGAPVKVSFTIPIQFTLQ